MLTNATVQAARPRPRAYKLHDSGGLHLLIRPTGSKSFRMKFRRGGKEQLLTFGRWPELTLAAARGRRDQVREQLDRGVDINVNDAAGGQSFEQLGRRWHAEQAEHWSAAHASDVLASLERDVFPAIGSRVPAEIRARDVRDLLRIVEARGCKESARRIRERISSIFRLGIHDELCEQDPAAIVADRLGPRPLQRPQPALTNLPDVQRLASLVDRTPWPTVPRLASAFLALTAVRLGALRGARWSEIEDLDGASPVWRIPAARMKLRKAKKADPSAEHLVPLSAQAVAVLSSLKPLTGGGELIFPGRRRGAPIGEGALRDLYAAAGYSGRHVPHGWRASFSTILNDRFPEEQSLIDQALAHAGHKGKVEAAYNRAQHSARLRDLFQRWADLLSPADRATDTQCGGTHLAALPLESHRDGD
ncbi:DUF4102 domain-containing protein [Sphingomonas ginkgonis]|uniref:DUF4102 domain-containing protein n=1 Tax=Sphingomonas ginkgonis TaxID=2315330 RepID=A0A3R9WRN1_9SPHN|nr:integrase arm-type DNA-binding domain-containing protein [Sphingomonas ginkgonis]RST30177.1 DUF4102 domain-containing protein [Sphingomonas ginkgonis]